MPADEHEGDDDVEAMVRPYTLTGGRTRPSGEPLAIEALVVAVAGVAPPAGLAPELTGLLARCASPVSIAELGALSRRPVGVVRVLVGDLVGHGLVSVHTGSRNGDRPDVQLLERVLAGIKAL